jgi:hypothetical protein
MTEATSRPEWATAPDVASLLAEAGIDDQVVGSAVHDGPQGPQRVALTSSGSDRIIGGIGVPGSTNAIVVRERATVFETVNRVLAAAAQWCGYTLGYKPVNDPQARHGSGGRVLIDIDHVRADGGSAHPEAPLALAAWVAAINTLMAGTTPQVTISVLGQQLPTSATRPDRREWPRCSSTVRYCPSTVRYGSAVNAALGRRVAGPAPRDRA